MNEVPKFTGVLCRGCQFTPRGCEIVEMLSPGEPLMIEREPTNPYDSNAIKVMDCAEVWFGYIGREYAVEIAPWMDRGVFFHVWKTHRIGCFTIITLEPLRAEEIKQTTSVHVDA